MKPRSLHRLAGAALLALSVGCRHAAPLESGQSEPAPKPRNIVFILTDDQRFDSLGMLNPWFQTPHLDELARGGILFENAFVTTALCSPSRATILTGQYAHIHGVLDNNNPMPPGTPVFPSELQRAGYETAFIGKWHMGGAGDDPQPGFNRWVSFKGQGVYTNPVLNVDGERIPHKGYITDLITDYAVDFIRREHAGPFMAYVSHKAVHAEFTPADRHKGAYDGRDYPFPGTMADTEQNYRGKPDWVRSQRQSWHGVDGMYNQTTTLGKFARDYSETLRAVDDSVGRIVAALRERGLLESTLIVFTSDNGFLFGEFGMIDKRSMYEPSMRVPLIVHCPEMIRPGQRRTEMIINLDFAPTFLEAAGLPVAATMQGRSFLPLLEGRETPWRDAFLYEYFWERTFPQTPTVLGVRTNTHKFMKYHGIWDRYEVYDIANDPQERINLVGDFIVRNEAGAVDHAIRSRAPEPVKSLFNSLDSRLNALLKESGALTEPSWRAD